MFKSHFSTAVREFASVGEQHLDVAAPPANILELRGALISEEANEVVEALDDFAVALRSDGTTQLLGPYKISKHRQAIAKELADLLYVTFGAAEALGIPIDEVFRRVHESNMSKFDDGKNGYKVFKNEIGKVIKGPRYNKPDLEDLFS